MLGFLFANSLGRQLSAQTQPWWPQFHVMGVGGNDVNEPVVQHPFRPILHVPAKTPSQRPRSDLHPNAGIGKPLDGFILGFYPLQSFRVG